jgi:Undecaprenyl-phosphate glucose phosphotransferase
MNGDAASTIIPITAAPTPPSAAPQQDVVLRRAIPRKLVAFLVRVADGAAVLVSGIVPVLFTAVRDAVNWQIAALVLPFGAVLAINLLQMHSAYRLRVLSRVGVATPRVAAAWFLTIGVLVLVVHFAGASPGLMHVWLPLWWVGGTALLIAIRLATASLIEHWKRAGRFSWTVAVVGTGPLAQRLLRRWAVEHDHGIEVVGVYDDRVKRSPLRCMGFPVLGTVDQLVADARRRRIDRVIVALPLSADGRLSEVLNRLSLAPVDIGLCTDLFGFQLSHCKVSHIGGLTFLDAVERPLSDWRWIAKDFEDRLLAGLILVAIAPLMLAIAALIKLDSPGPVFFRQKRYGFNNQLIEILKFRTMHHHAQDPDATRLTQRNDPRVTRLGALLRRTSLDELPQFINVLRGEMSIVGPRPHAVAAKAGGLLYRDAVRYYDARHRVKPGITGWAQVNGWRGETETTEQITRRVEHDLYYIENWSLAFDLKIILRTIFGGLTGRYVY